MREHQRTGELETFICKSLFYKKYFIEIPNKLIIQKNIKYVSMYDDQCRSRMLYIISKYFYPKRLIIDDL